MSPTSPRAAWRSVQTTLLDIAPAFTSKRVLARYLSTILCCIVVVVRPFSRLGGKYAFLVLVLKELVFSVQASLAQQLELTVLNILGAFLGIAISTLAKFIASMYPGDTATARATCAVFLVIISFFGESNSAADLTSPFTPRSRASQKSFTPFATLHANIVLCLYMDLDK